MLNTYIYHLLPPICFIVCYIIFRETIAQELDVICNVVNNTETFNIQRTVHRDTLL